MTRVGEPDDPFAFRFEPQLYTLRTPGGGRARFAIAWSAELLADIEALRRAERDPAVVQRLGDRLRAALRDAGWERLSAEVAAASRAGRGVIITLRSNAAELYALPWELLTVGSSGQHLGELVGVGIRYEWPATTTTPEEPSPRPEGGRILLAWSSAGGPVPAAEHRAAIEEACAEGQLSITSGCEELAHASAPAIFEALADAASTGKPFAALHLLCHGGRVGSAYGLVLDGADGSPTVVDPGRLRQLLAPHAATLRLVVLAACDGGNAGDPSSHLGSAAQALHRAGIHSVLASRYPLSVAGSTILTQQLYRRLLVDLESLERAFIGARASLARGKAGLDWASLQLYARAADGDDSRPFVFRPYRGLLSFEARQRRFFFGRDAELKETLGDLQGLIDSGAPRFLVVVGASGTGKSSIVLSGVVSDVDALRPRSGGPWEVARMVPGATPMATLEEILGGRADPQRPLLILVDQFEELFTHVDDAGDREAFARRIWDLTRRDTGVHCIITLRVDFLGDCGEIVLDETGISLDRVGYDEAYRVFVARMSPAQVRAAIVGPASRVGLSFAPGLVERIVSDVGHEPGALPLLQYALDRLWLQREGRVLSARVYEAIGGLVGALEQEADQLIDGLDVDEERHARRLLTRLVGIADDDSVDTRQRVKLGDLEPADTDARAVFVGVLMRLVNARLVVRDEEGGVTHLVIAHEALIRRWERLHAWIREDRYKLAELAKLKDWVRQRREHGTLLGGAQLGYASDIVERHGDDVDGSMRALVEESSRREQRQRRLVWAALVVLAAGVIGLAGLSLYALEQTRRASELLGTTKGLVEGLLEDVLPQLEGVAGTADARRELHDRVHEILEVLRRGEEPDEDLLHLAIWEKIRRGRLATTHGRLDEARVEFSAALDLAEAQLAADPGDVRSRHELSAVLTELGNLHWAAGELSAARQHHERALLVDEALAASDPSDVQAGVNVVVDLGGLGALAREAGDLVEARRQLGRARELGEALVARSPGSSEARRALAGTYESLMDIETLTQDLTAARGLSELALVIRRAEVRAAPDDAGRKADLAAAISGRGAVELDAGEFTAALEFFRKSAQIAADFARADPEDSSKQLELARALTRIAHVEYQLGDLRGARADYDRAIEICASLVELDPENVEYQVILQLGLNWVGTLAITSGNYEDALTYTRRALAVSQRLVGDGEPNSGESVQLAGDIVTLAYVKRHGGALDEARADVMRALEIIEEQVTASAENATFEGYLALVLNEFGLIEMRRGNEEDAERHLRRALEIQERRTAEEEGSEARTLFDVGETLLALGELALLQGRYQESRADLERALATGEAALEHNQADGTARRRCVLALALLARAEAGLGDSARSLEHDKRALRLVRAGLEVSPDDSILAFTRIELLMHRYEIARRAGDVAAERHREAACAGFAEMDERGQIQGFAQREALGARLDLEVCAKRQVEGREDGGR